MSADDLGPFRRIADELEALTARAEATINRVRGMAGAWAQTFDNALTEEGKTLGAAGRAILNVLDGEPE